MTEPNEGRFTAYTCPLWHRDADGWCIDERPHLAAVPFEPTQQCLIHLEPDVAHCRGCAADSKAAG